MKSGLRIRRLALALLCPLVLVSLATFGILNASAEIVPTDRLYSGWRNAGVIGGIPNSSGMTIYTTITSTGDTTDRSSTINSAIASCPSNQVVQLGPGLFRVNSTIAFQNEKGVVLRGTVLNGTNGTILDVRANATGVLMGNGNADWPWNNTGTSLGANAPQGTNVLIFSDTSAISAGNFLRIYQNDYQSSNMVIMSVNGLGKSQTFQVKAVSKTSTTVTIEDPIPWALFTGRSAGVHVIGDGFAERCGLEKITLDCRNGTTTDGVKMWNAYNCWLLDVPILNPGNHNIYSINAIHCTIKRCNLDSIQNAGSNGAGHLHERSSLCLFEDSRIHHSFPLIEWNFGCSGNVFAYNIVEDGVQNIGMDLNHGAHCSYNLFEGNVTPDINPDGYFGSVSHETVLRNRVTGVPYRGNTADSESVPIELKRLTRYFNIVGNVIGTSSGSWTYEKTANGDNGPVIYMLGYPNIGNRGYSGTAEPSTGDNWASWGGFPGPSGFQERDLDVANTLIRKGNYNYANRAVPAGESTGGDAIPNSYYLASKPSWFGNLTWPPFDPGSPIANWTDYYSAIPAGYRLLYGTNPPAGGPVNQPPVAIATASIRTGVSPLTVVFSSVGSFDPEGAALSYNWVFGDGKTSTAANPTNTYAASGPYSARLTVSDGVNAITSSAISITVEITPPPNFRQAP